MQTTIFCLNSKLTASVHFESLQHDVASLPRAWHQCGLIVILPQKKVYELENISPDARLEKLGLPRTNLEGVSLMWNVNVKAIEASYIRGDMANKMVRDKNFLIHE